MVKDKRPSPQGLFYPYGPHPACGHLLPLPRAKDNDPLPPGREGEQRLDEGCYL
jgi:hypothetical protein